MSLESTTDQIYPDIDPRLQWAIDKGARDRFAATESNDIVPVIAKVTDIRTWEGMTGVSETTPIGMTPDGSGHIVTARVLLSELSAIRRDPNVISLKQATPIRPTLEIATKSVNAKRELLPPSRAKEQGGRGVIIGIVDFGCDFVHRNFINQDGTTRILALWDQTVNMQTTGEVNYGRVFTRDEINQALHTSSPYETLGYPASGHMQEGQHGTHVMDIAAGNGRGTSVEGVAPEADIIFVEFAGDVPYQQEGSSFGDSVHLLEAIRFIFNRADRENKSCVVNLSLGTNGGPHDGTSLVEQGIDAMLNERDNRAVVIAASNSYSSGIHASGIVRRSKNYDLYWKINRTDLTSNELEVWYSGADVFSAEIFGPDGNSFGKLQLATNARVKDSRGNIVGFAAHRKGDPNNGDNTIDIFLEKSAPSGIWMIRLQGVEVVHGSFHAWIERDDMGQSSFVPPNDNTHTLGSIGCGRKSIVVGCYDARDPDTPIAYFSSAGPTRDGRPKPELSAPGFKVTAANSNTIDKAIEMSGTSMAAPVVTGVVALLLGEASARGVRLSAGKIRQILRKTTKSSHGNKSEWDERHGMGRIDAKAAILYVHYELNEE
ncbi:uncharacterized protein VTP21DRAFT_12 [Calcarisporiella thermophila]|uniref:uncharacterized protein n=1 Tax=Calcarisporiella thermophila TaxID=911321 RepID=UPI003743E392